MKIVVELIGASAVVIGFIAWLTNIHHTSEVNAENIEKIVEREQINKQHYLKTERSLGRIEGKIDMLLNKK